VSFLTKTLKDAFAKVNAMSLWKEGTSVRPMTDLEIMICLTAFPHQSEAGDKAIAAELRKVRIPC